jgi:hypothetical protein
MMTVSQCVACSEDNESYLTEVRELSADEHERCKKTTKRLAQW